jgi:hypothetical protein
MIGGGGPYHGGGGGPGGGGFPYGGGGHGGGGPPYRGGGGGYPPRRHAGGYGTPHGPPRGTPGGHGGPPPGPPPGSTAPPDPDSDDERFSYKPDLKVYPDYTKLEDWTTWFRKVKNLLCTHGLERILDAAYEPDPANPKSIKKWVRKQRFVYTMLEQRVLILTSRRIVQKYDDTMDGRQALLDLADQARHSTEAVLSGRHTREKIGQARYDPRSGSALQFITKFEETMEKYNLQQRNPGMVLTGPMMKSYIQAALVGVMMLRGVTDREHDRMIQGGTEYTYEEYLEAVKSAASIYDEGTSGRRSVNVAMASGSHDVESEIAEYFINATSRRAPGATMRKETWQTISEEGKSIWDKMSNSDKQKILQSAMKRVAAKESLSVNQTITHEHDENTEDRTALAETYEEESEGGNPETEVNKVDSQAKREAHPGDIRRVLSGTGKKKTAQIRFAQWSDEPEWHDTMEIEDGIDGMVDGYDWDPDDELDFHRGD